MDCIHLGDEAIAAPGKSFDVLRALGIVPQGFPNFHYGKIQPVLKVNKGAVGPKGLLNFLAGHELTMPFEKEKKQLKRLRLEGNKLPGFAQFTRFHVEFERAEAQR